MDMCTPIVKMIAIEIVKVKVIIGNPDMDDGGSMLQFSKAVPAWRREFLRVITFGDSCSECISHRSSESEGDSHHMRSGYGWRRIHASM